MEASTLVIFGATGDLTYRKLMPALFNLTKENRLPENFNIVAFARRDYTKEQYAAEILAALKKFDTGFDDGSWKKFAPHLHYVQGDLVNLSDFVKLATFLKQFDPENACTNKIFYMATAPNYFTGIIENLESSQVASLMGECWTRIIIEKPFGYDLKSAQDLNKLIDDKFDESLIYRIDHYLAKETVQNILTFRFANGLFEPIWNKDFIDHIQITVSEELGVESRGGYYDQSGNLRDFVQNHILQLLAITTMEQPKSFEAEAIRDSRLQVLKQLKPMTTVDIEENVVLGQYLEGVVHGEKFVGYLDEDKVENNSKTDTFGAFKVFIDSPRWEGVPIYLRSGKRLEKKNADISIHFKESANKLFPTDIKRPNILTFHIQPKQEVTISVLAKEPGQTLKMKQVLMKLNYQEVFHTEEAEPYEKLILDIISGVQTFFPRADEVEASWKFIDPIIKAKADLPLRFYPAGSKGPKEADDLIAKDDR